jgi:hypothetical protein
MPPAVAVPLAIAGVGLVSQNANNKAAIKNNEVQQASAVGNSKEAYATAKNDLNSYINAHPAPFSGMTPDRPQAGSYGPGGVTSPSSYNVRSGPSKSGAPALPQGLMALIQAIMQQQRSTQPTQRSTNTPPPAGPTATDPAQQIAASDAGSPPPRPDGLTLDAQGLGHKYEMGVDQWGRPTTVGSNRQVFTQMPGVNGQQPIWTLNAPPGTAPSAPADPSVGLARRILGRQQAVA